MNNHKLKITILSFIFLIIINIPVLSEEVITSKDFLTLSDAIKIGIENNHNVKKAIEQVNNAELQVLENTAQGLPQVSLTTNFGRQDPINATISPGMSAFSSSPQFAAFLGTSSVNNFNSKLQLTQTLFAGFRVIDGVKLANISVNMMKENLNQIKQDVALNVTLSYFNALRAYQLVEISQEALIQAESHLDMAQKLLKSGVGIKLDVIRAQNQIVTVQQQLSQNKNNLYKSKIALNLAMGRNIDVPITLNPSAMVQDIKIDQEKLLEKALSNRPEIKQLKYKKEMDELAALIQSRSSWPIISLYASYNIQDNQVINGNLNDTQNLSYGINMNWPIFDGLGSSAKAKRSQNNALQDQISIDQLQQSISLEIKSNMLDIQEARERIIMAQKGIELALEGLRMAQIRYKEGVGLGIDVIDAAVALVQAKSNLVFATFDLNVAKAKLYRTLGINL